MPDLDGRVAAFIRRCIDSVETLHVLLVLRESPERSWTAERLSDELRSSPNAITRRLEQLQRAGLAAPAAEGVRYAASAEDDMLAGLLQESYRLRRTTVIDAIFSGAPDPLRSFSDAFKLGEDKP